MSTQFSSSIGPYQVLPLRARVDLGVMAMKGYPAFFKAPALLKPHHQTVWCHIRTLVGGGGSYPSAEMYSDVDIIIIIIIGFLV